MFKHKIIHLSKYYKPYFGGMESVVADIAEGLVIKGHEQTVITSYSKNDDLNVEFDTKIKGVKVLRCKEYGNFASTSISFDYLKKTFTSIDKSIVHIHLPNPLSNLGVFIAYILGKRPKGIVLHWQSDIIKQKFLFTLYKPLLSFLLKISNVIIVTSQNYLEGSVQLKKYKHKCRVIPIGIDKLPPCNKSSIDEIKKKFNNKKIVFSLGRHIYYKGFEYLIHAVHRLNRDDTVFVIGGIGPDTEKYSRLIDQLGLNGKIFLVGKIPSHQLTDYFHAADVFCFPSVEKSEAFGVVQLEAMSVGTPVLSTSIEGSGVPWVNKHLESGLICQPKSADLLAISLDEILNDPMLHNKLCAGAEQRFNDIFTKELMLNSILQIYTELDT